MPAESVVSVATSLPREIVCRDPRDITARPSWGNTFPIEPVSPDMMRRPGQLGLSVPSRAPFKLGMRGVPDTLYAPLEATAWAAPPPAALGPPPRPPPSTPPAVSYNTRTGSPQWQSLIAAYGQEGLRGARGRGAPPSSGHRRSLGGEPGPLQPLSAVHPTRYGSPIRYPDPHTPLPWQPGQVDPDKVIAGLVPNLDHPAYHPFSATTAEGPPARGLPTAEEVLNGPGYPRGAHERLRLLGSRQHADDAIQRGIDAGWIHGYDPRERVGGYETLADKLPSLPAHRDALQREVEPIVRDLDDFSNFLATSVKGSLCDIVLPEGEGDADAAPAPGQASATRRRFSIASVGGLGTCAILSPADPAAQRDAPLNSPLTRADPDSGTAASYANGGWFDYMQLSHIVDAYFSLASGIMVLTTPGREWRIRISRTSADKWLELVHRICYWLRPGYDAGVDAGAVVDLRGGHRLAEVAPGVHTTTTLHPHALGADNPTRLGAYYNLDGSTDPRIAGHSPGTTATAPAETVDSRSFAPRAW